MSLEHRPSGRVGHGPGDPRAEWRRDQGRRGARLDPVAPRRADGPVLTRRSLNRALLARQHLLHRVEVGAAEEVAHLVGLQAQEPLDPFTRSGRASPGSLDLAGAPLPGADTAAPVRFLPEFDNVTLGHADRSRIVPDGLGSSVLIRIDPRPQTILVDGMVAGLWRVSTEGATARPSAPSPLDPSRAGRRRDRGRRPAVAPCPRDRPRRRGGAPSLVTPPGHHLVRPRTSKVRWPSTRSPAARAACPAGWSR